MELLIKKLPKTELHLHIEGTLEPELMFEIAKRNKITLPYSSVDELKLKYNFKDLGSFLDIYYSGLNVLCKKQDFYELTFEYLKRAHSDGVKHIEIFIDPQSHTKRGIEFSEVINGIQEALEFGSKLFRISYFIIMCFQRHLSEEDAMETLEQSKPFKHLIKAVGLDSYEKGNPPVKFQNVYEKASEMGYLLVAHAGEEGPPQYIWDALNLLKVSRIDHGIRCIEDNKLIEKLVKEKIPLTVCPLSNVKLKVFEKLEDHTLKKLYDLGIHVTINSDDPAYFGGYILENYLQCYHKLQLSFPVLCQISKYGFEASFMDEQDKMKFFNEIDNIEDEFNKSL